MPPKGWKKPVDTSGPVSQEEAAEVIARAEGGLAEVMASAKRVEIPPAERPQWHPDSEFKAVFPISKETAAAIRTATEIKIVCKVKDGKDVTKSATSHDAMWLKEYV